VALALYRTSGIHIYNMTILIVGLLYTASLLPPLGPVRESALPLAGKRVLLLSSRVDAAPFASRLVEAGARPIWCPAVRVDPLDDYSDLDDALMRLAEYDVLVTFSTQSIDAIAGRFLSLADGSLDVVRAMLEASNVEIGALGSDALHMRGALGVPATIVPIEPSARALASTLADLGHVHPGARVLVASSQGCSPLIEPPEGIASFLAQLASSGAEVDRVPTHELRVTDDASRSAELGLLTTSQIDAVIVTTLEEAAAGVLGGEHWPLDKPPLVVALGDDAAEATREATREATSGGSGAMGEVIELGARPGPAAAIAALEGHFGAGRLLF